MASSSPPSSEYGTLLQGDHGFILAIALTVLVVLALSFITKFYFSWRRINITKKQVGSTDNTVLASDAIWLLSHVFAFVYLGVRISTLGGLTDEDSKPLSSAQKSHLAHANEACQIFFLLALYLSFCSALCIVLIIPVVSGERKSTLKSPIYFVPFVVFIIGALLSTLPRIGCNARFIFPGQQHLCPSPNARMLPAIVLVTILDIAVAVYWGIFVYRQTYRVVAGRVTVRQPWPVAPFMLRFFNVGANIAFMDIYVRANSNSVRYYTTFYPELLAILVSLTATTSVSMSRILGKLNFAGVAYTMDPNLSRSHNQSGAAGSNSGTRTGNNARQQSQCRTRPGWDLDGWRNQSTVLKTTVSAHANHRTSIESLLQNESITQKVEIQQTWEEGGSVNSHSNSL